MQEDPNKSKMNNHIYQKLFLIMFMAQVHVQPSRLELELLHKLRITLAVVYFSLKAGFHKDTSTRYLFGGNLRLPSFVFVNE